MFKRGCFQFYKKKSAVNQSIQVASTWDFLPNNLHQQFILLNKSGPPVQNTVNHSK